MKKLNAVESESQRKQKALRAIIEEAKLVTQINYDDMQEQSKVEVSIDNIISSRVSPKWNLPKDKCFSPFGIFNPQGLSVRDVDWYHGYITIRMRANGRILISGDRQNEQRPDLEYTHNLAQPDHGVLSLSLKLKILFAKLFAIWGVSLVRCKRLIRRVWGLDLNIIYLSHFTSLETKWQLLYVNTLGWRFHSCPCHFGSSQLTFKRNNLHIEV